ncbi:MAG: hypothetical protein L0Z62_47625 [Gemmataceae bacterium]|nr:hypothetical protein [Gemmataceae bacterium]
MRRLSIPLIAATLLWPLLTTLPAASGPGKPQDKPSGLDLGAGEKADDVVRRGLLAGPKVPTDVLAVRRHLLEKLGGKLKMHIVANGGHEHPMQKGVVFMCFETYSGSRGDGTEGVEDELFLGFFLVPDGDTLAVGPTFLEVIAWDRTKKLYNFWELIRGRWHYRGDSRDILADVAQVNMGAAKPVIGNRLRCSGCHTLGGPIMKELEPPHNDWWTAKRPLPVKPWMLEQGKNTGDPRQAAGLLLRNATDAANLSSQVKRGIDRLLAGGALWTGRSPKEQLRSLFSTMEMNLISDRVPFQERQAQEQAIEIPTGFFVDARLAGEVRAVTVSLKRYREALVTVGSRFPHNAKAGTETRHAFLVPGRSYIDNRVLDDLIARKILDEELIADVLAVDFTAPAYSGQRGALIRFVPDRAGDVKELRGGLIEALKQAPAKDQAAQELLANLTDPKRTAAHHRDAARAYLVACVRIADDDKAVIDWLKVASQRRVEVLFAETARSREDNILEPTFRRAFPADDVGPMPGRWRLDPGTGRLAR